MVAGGAPESVEKSMLTRSAKKERARAQSLASTALSIPSAMRISARSSTGGA
jgi:hypothetical protein